MNEDLVFHKDKFIKIKNMINENEKLKSVNKDLCEALRIVTIRLEICLGRMRRCHEETGKHELLDEVEMFVDEAKKTFKKASE